MYRMESSGGLKAMTNCDEVNSTAIKLSSLKKNDVAIIAHVPNHCLLAPLGIRTGKKVQVHSIHPFSGPYMLDIDGRQIAISRHITRDILVLLC